MKNQDFAVTCIAMLAVILNVYRTEIINFIKATSEIIRDFRKK